jgi:hypothetical protein
MERNGVWSRLLGVSTLYDPRQGTIAYDFHPHEPGGFAPLDVWMEAVAGELDRREALGLETCGWAIVKRTDVGVDVGFADPEVGRAFYEALRDRRYTRGRRVQERQPGWFAIYGRGTRQAVQHARVYDKGVESRSAPPWRWMRTERIMRWERRSAMRLSLLTPGALRHAYGDLFVDGLVRGTLVQGDDVVARLVSAVVEGHMSVRHYEEVAGYLLAERGGLAKVVYAGRPDQLSQRERMTRELGISRDGSHGPRRTEVDLLRVVTAMRDALTDASRAGRT